MLLVFLAMLAAATVYVCTDFGKVNIKVTGHSSCSQQASPLRELTRRRVRSHEKAISATQVSFDRNRRLLSNATISIRNDATHVVLAATRQR